VPLTSGYFSPRRKTFFSHWLKERSRLIDFLSSSTNSFRNVPLYLLRRRTGRRWSPRSRPRASNGGLLSCSPSIDNALCLVSEEETKGRAQDQNQAGFPFSATLAKALAFSLPRPAHSEEREKPLLTTKLAFPPLFNPFCAEWNFDTSFH